MTKKVATRARKKSKTMVSSGVVRIHASFNNTIVTVTDPQGNVLSWATSGGSGFKGSRKSTPYAAQIAATTAVKKAVADNALREADAIVQGPGPGKEAALRAAGSIIKLKQIADFTPVPHNGCRPEKERRV